MEGLITLRFIALYASATVFTILAYAPYAGFASSNAATIYIIFHIGAILFIAIFFSGLLIGDIFFGLDNNLAHPNIYTGTAVTENQEQIETFHSPDSNLVHLPTEVKFLAAGFLITGFFVLGILWATVPLPISPC